jgi:pimeloyl-ACP methyl ester carboxylesterase
MLTPLGDYVHKDKFCSQSRRDCTYANLLAYFTCFDPAEALRAYTNYKVRNFDELQQMILLNCADSVNKKLRGRKLVVLIHGFNDTAVAEYAILKRQINKTISPEIPFYLEVYWDGLKAWSEEFFDIVTIWDRANATAPYAAYTLRKLFAMIGDADTYIVAHSLGACVATRLLFNPKDRRRFPLKKQWAALPTPSQSRIHLALLAPAIAGERIFKHFCQTVPNGQCANYKSILIGYNKHDYATTKKCRWPLSFIDHSTALGCHGGIVKRVGILVKNQQPALQFQTVDFSDCLDSHHSHHIYQYVKCGKFDEFIKQVFASQ